MKNLLFVLLVSTLVSGCSAAYKSTAHGNDHSCECSKDKKDGAACTDCKDKKDGAEHECADCKK